MTGHPAVEVVATLQLDPVPASAGTARRAVVDAVTAMGRGDLADTAGLLVTELVTNAIVHARTSIIVTIAANAFGLRVEVNDSSPHIPMRRGYGSTATTGRGVAVVEMLAERFGTDATSGTGKTVWFELGTTSAPAQHAGAAQSLPAAVATVRIHLEHVPVALARAWQQHTDTLLREHFLASWDTDMEIADLADRQAGAGEMFSCVSEALAPLFIAADQPEHGDVMVDLPVGAAHGFRDLDFILDRAIVMAEAGELLAPTTQPEIRRLRLWISEQAITQAEGRAASPWTGLAADEPMASIRPVDWDLAAVLSATEATIAADDANCIIAASPDALALLGWTLDELVGRRIVSVIPHRFREAHIAAFTLYLLTDRTTILNTPVTVPALRRDGTEVTVELLVRRESAGGGRAVFVATMQPAQTHDDSAG
ncbi:MAG: PAS domain S-box protein [Sporichthyaceae bacterium]